MRIFLNNLIEDGDEPVDINDLKKFPFSHASGRNIFDQALGFSSTLLSRKELRRLQADVYRHFASRQEKTVMLKVHDAYTYTNGKPDFPTEATHSAIYILRNPLEVACSYAHHRNSSIEKTIECMEDKNHSMAASGNRAARQVWQRLQDWSSNVESWTSVTEFPVLVVRYEEMLENTFVTFRKAAEFLNYPTDEKRIRKAIEFSSFENVQKLESEGAFREKPVKAKNFFRSGKSDSWKDTLDSRQVDLIKARHGKVMKKFGYV